MRATLLGTGTSQGIPVIGCDCPACTSMDKRDKRLRCSLLIEDENHSIVVDVGPDFRQQMLRQKVQNLDAVLLTHEHNDHIIGLDDLRPLIFKQRKPMTIYGEERVLADVKRRFGYAFEAHTYPGVPSFNLVPISPGDTLKLGGISIQVLRVQHGHLHVLCFRIRDFAYVTDTNGIPAQTRKALLNLEVLILDTLHKRRHHSHFNFDEAIEMANLLNAQNTYFIHMSHNLGPTNLWETELPKNIFPSYDGQRFDI